MLKSKQFSLELLFVKTSLGNQAFFGQIFVPHYYSSFVLNVINICALRFLIMNSLAFAIFEPKTENKLLILFCISLTLICMKNLSYFCEYT